MPSSASERFRRAARTSVQNNAAVYGYSVMITASMASLQVTAGGPSLARIFLFVSGAALAFATVEAAATNLFRHRAREEKPEVVVLGSAMGLGSIAGAVAVATAVGEVAPSWVGWLAGPYLATATYLLAVSVELALASRAEENLED